VVGAGGIHPGWVLLRAWRSWRCCLLAVVIADRCDNRRLPGQELTVVVVVVGVGLAGGHAGVVVLEVIAGPHVGVLRVVGELRPSVDGGQVATQPLAGGDDP
jgi:hypothetical protein